MKIISFFSFKGGVGRTALLSNLGAYWASNDKVVLLIDLDLSAPGLTYSMKTRLLDERGTKTGISDMLYTFFEKRSENPQHIKFMNPRPLIRQVKLTGPKLESANENLFLIPAGAKQLKIDTKDNIETEQPIQTIPGYESQQTESDEEFAFRTFAHHLKKALADWRVPKGMKLAGHPIDYVLIDCRTGFPELINLSLGYLAHKMVIVSSLNDQNLQGLKYTLEALKARRIPIGHFPGLLSIVFSPLPATEDESVFERIEKAHEIVIQAMRYDRTNNRELAPESFSLHYTQTLAIREALLVLEHPKSIYSKEVIAIANHLEGKASEEDFQDEFIKQARRKAMKVVSQPKEKTIDPQTQIDQQVQTIPFAELPPWYWPVQEFYENENARSKYVDKLIPNFPAHINRENFLNSLCYGVSLDKKQKQEILNSLKISHSKQIVTLIDTFIKIFEEELRTFLNLWIDARTHNAKYLIMKMYFDRQSEWAKIILEDEEKGNERFLRATMQDHVFPLWEKSSYYWDLLANKLADQARYQEAENAYRKAIELDEKFAYPWNGLGALLTDHFSHYEEAEAAYRKAIELDPKYASPWNNLGNLLKDHLSRYEEAEQAYRKAIELVKKK